ncbi:MAG TPA: M15 family metallopeptidase [Longimicrobiales bacterium]|nr:M15 family metallopeptidase [Longimicrobiales bacterium]
MQLRILIAVGVCALLPACSARPAPEPYTAAPLVAIRDIDPTILVEARYHGSHNFIGRPIAGYEAPKCLLTPAAARALAEVQDEVRSYGLTLKTYDCYRPQRAVDDFVQWARVASDTAMKAEFYPAVDKRNLFRDGYIAERSGHSRGSTVDLTLVPLPVAGQPEYEPGDPLTDCRSADRFADNSLDMGTGYDCFDPLSHTANTDAGAVAARNRLLLKLAMEKHGFTNYANEWWHYTLRDEPYPDTWFDVPVR